MASSRAASSAARGGAARPRHSLWFIVDAPSHHATSLDRQSGRALHDHPQAQDAPAPAVDGRRRSQRSQSQRVYEDHRQAQRQTAVSTAKKAAKASAEPKRPTAAMTYAEKRLARKCTVDDCPNYTINSGLCFRHGGGKTCTIDNCNSSAKIKGLCWKHGGSVRCQVSGCNRRGKSRGLCWAHGGGTKCQADSCEKVAVSVGLCWAHGGGKRCLYDGCQRPAYQRTLNYCPKHFSRFENGDEVLEV